MAVFGNPEKFRVQELEDELEQVQHDHEIEINKLNRAHEKEVQQHVHAHANLQDSYDQLTDDHSDDIEDLQTRHEQEIERINREFNLKTSGLEAQIEGLESLERSHQENVTTASKLTEQQTTFEAEKSAFGDVKTAVKRAREEGAANAAAEYKKGYADGLSDGLRKGMDHTKGDREEFAKMAHKVVDNYKQPQLPAVASPDIVIVQPNGTQRVEKKNKD